jgi:hypothetical protein
MIQTVNNLKYIVYGVVTTIVLYLIIWGVNKILSPNYKPTVGQIWVYETNREFPPGTRKHEFQHNRIIKIVNDEYIGYIQNGNIKDTIWVSKKIFLDGSFIEKRF